MEHRLLFIFCSVLIVSGQLVSNVRIVNLPEQSNIKTDLTKIEKIIKNLDDIVMHKYANDDIDYLTPEEAREYLSDYVLKKYGKEEGEKLIAQYFNDKYFSVGGPEKEETVAQIARNDSYLFGHIQNMLTRGIPGNEGTMENARKRWGPKTLILTPKEVFDAYVQDKTYGADMPIKDFEEYKKKFPKEVETIFSERYFGLPQDIQERKKYFLTQGFGFFTQQLVADIYKTAQRVMVATKQGDYIVIFGNTPYFVGRVLEKLISKDPNDPKYRNIIEFPFSGAPNQQRAGNFPNYKDLVTKERLDHLNKRLKTAGLSPENKDLQKHAVYFVDVIGQGSGLAYTIEELLRTFKKAGVSIPNFNIISLNEINIKDEDDPRHARIANNNAGDGQKLTFYFPTKDNVHFTIDAQVIFLPGHGKLDQLRTKDWRIFPEYNAAYWQPKYDYLLRYPKKNRVTDTMLEYFDTNLDHIMHEKASKEEE